MLNIFKRKSKSFEDGEKEIQKELDRQDEEIRALQKRYDQINEGLEERILESELILKKLGYSEADLNRLKIKEMK